jgi:serine/threonine protein kinase
MAPDEAVGGRYVLGAVLGRGGMGEVRIAHDRRLDRDVAVKVLDGSSRDKPDALARFEYEARAAAALAHPNVVQVYDYGDDGARVYLVMEALSGRTLADEIAKGRVAPERLVDVAIDVLAGLGAAHEHGIVHRDIKPGNVLFDERGRAKIGDFGVATSGTTNLTQTGLVLGTPAYVAPERLAGQVATPRSDLYALGVVCYEALSGTKPFTGDGPLAVAHAIDKGQTLHLRERCPDLPAELCDVVMRAMQHEPEHRYTSATQFADALRGAVMTPDDRTVEVAPVAPVAPDATQAVPRTIDRTAALPQREPTLPSRQAPAASRSARRSRAPLVFFVVLVVLLGVVALAWYVNARDDNGTGTQPGNEQPLPGPVQDAFKRLEQLVQR